MPTVQYMISFSSGTNADKKDGQTQSGRITRDSGSTPPSGAVVTRAVCNVNSVRVYTSKNPYLELGSYGYTNTLSYNESVHSESNLSVTLYGSSILSVNSEAITITVRSSGSGNALNIRDGGSIYLTVEYDVSYTYTTSTATLSPIFVEAGESMTVKISNPNLANLAHQVMWRFGTNTYTVDLVAGRSSTSYTIPVSWANSITGSTSGTGTVTVYTYIGSVNGSYLGSNSYTFSLGVPSTALPIVGSITATIVNNSVPSEWGVYVQNISGVKLQANDATGAYGSTISSYNFTQGDTVINGTGATRTIGTITQSGVIRFSVTVTDSRGRTSAPKSVSISVQPYSSPTFTDSIAFRCLDDQTPSESGTYVGARAAWSFSSLDNRNTQSATCEYRRTGITDWETAEPSIESGETYYFGDGSIEANYTYEIRFTIRDLFRTVERIITVSTAMYTMFFREGGTGIGFGKACERNNSVEISDKWTFYYGSQNLMELLQSINSKIIYSDTEPTEATEGQIWLKPR